MKGWKIISPISMYPNGGHESTNHFKARFEWKCSAELWRNGDKKRGWVRISGFFFTRMKIAQNPWLYRYRNVVYANENKSCIGETSTRLESSAGILWSHVVCAGKWVSNALWSRRNPWTGGLYAAYIPAKRAFCSRSPISPPSSSPLLFLRLMRACYAVGYVGREEQLAEGWNGITRGFRVDASKNENSESFSKQTGTIWFIDWKDICIRRYVLLLYVLRMLNW